VQIFVDDWSAFRPVRTGVALACALRRLYPKAWAAGRFGVLLGHRATLEGLQKGAGWRELEEGWQEPLRRFVERRRACLLYGD
jgi:uncharacterized protein YbbC (DUF1343 family)